MTTIKTPIQGRRFHSQAYDFVFSALRFTQEHLGRRAESPHVEEEGAHITGQELLEGIRRFGSSRFGLLTNTVFRHWGIYTTGDFGRIVFELIERGEMRKTERDHLEDFFNVYDFDDAFDRDYVIDTRQAFRR